VRAHLGHLGLPIVGDELYGARLPPGVDRRLYLHACSVELAHPASGATMRIQSPLPAAFALCYGSEAR
jgi:23S rRNA-/tRNA-specific pseudouridylate synthase